MKSITIAGNCTKDAAMRSTQSGQTVASFSVAVNGFDNGEKSTTYFDVSIWGKRGESVMQFAKKGAKICVTGSLGTREYNGRTYLTVNASDFTPMGGKSDASGGDDYAPAKPQAGGFDLDDEIPFD